MTIVRTWVAFLLDFLLPRFLCLGEEGAASWTGPNEGGAEEVSGTAARRKRVKPSGSSSAESETVFDSHPDARDQP